MSGHSTVSILESGSAPLVARHSAKYRSPVALYSRLCCIQNHRVQITFKIKFCLELHSLDIQGGSNMTGTNCDLFTHNYSRSYLNHLVEHVVRYSVVGITTRYGLDGPGIEFRWGRNFPSRPALGPSWPVLGRTFTLYIYIYTHTYNIHIRIEYQDLFRVILFSEPLYHPVWHY